MAAAANGELSRIVQWQGARSLIAVIGVLARNLPRDSLLVAAANSKRFLECTKMDAVGETV